MNIYKVITFDGFNSKEYLVNGYDVVGAIQDNGMIITNHVIKVELIGSENKESYT